MKAPESVEIKPLQICRDRSDFKLGRADDVAGTLEAHLSRSKYLVVLCSEKTPGSPYVRLEVEWFLKHRSAQAILVVVTEGVDPASRPEEVMPAALVAAGIARRPFYNLRGRRRWRARRWTKVRDSEEQLAMLAAHLHEDTAGKLMPVWLRDARTKARRRLFYALVAVVGIWALAIFAFVQRANAVANASAARAAADLAKKRQLEAERQEAAARNFGLPALSRDRRRFL